MTVLVEDRGYPLLSIGQLEILADRAAIGRPARPLSPDLAGGRLGALAVSRDVAGRASRAPDPDVRRRAASEIRMLRASLRVWRRPEFRTVMAGEIALTERAIDAIRYVASGWFRRPI